MYFPHRLDLSCKGIKNICAGSPDGKQVNEKSEPLFICATP